MIDSVLNKYIEALRMFDAGWELEPISKALEITVDEARYAVNSGKVKDAYLSEKQTPISALGGMRVRL